MTNRLWIEVAAAIKSLLGKKNCKAHLIERRAMSSFTSFTLWSELMAVTNLIFRTIDIPKGMAREPSHHKAWY